MRQISTHRTALASAFLGTLWRARRLCDRAALEAWQARGVDALIRHAAATTTFYAPYRGASLAHLPVVDKAAHLADFAAFNGLALSAEAAWDVIGGSATRPGFEVGCSTGTSGQRGLYVISQAERFRWLGVMLAKALPDVLRRRHRVAVLLPGPGPLYQSANQSLLLRLLVLDPRPESPFSPCGRRWREARDEGSLELGGSSGASLHRASDPSSALRAPSPARGEGRSRPIPREEPEHIVAPLEAFAPSIIVAAPKTLRWLAGRGVAVQPEKVFAAAEILDPPDRAIIERAFGVGLGQIYMATEGLMGVSCGHGALHLVEDVARFELEPAGDGLVTPLVTDFTRRTQVLARYRLGDLLRVAPACPCGSPCRAVTVVGRREDRPQLRGADGRTVTLAQDALRDTLLAAVPTIDDFRIYRLSSNMLLVRLPLDVDAATAERARAALEAACRRAGAATNVVMERLALAAPFDRKLRRVMAQPPERP